MAGVRNDHVSRRFGGAVPVVVAALMLAGCVGPATTDAAYSGKAIHAAGAAESAVQTAVLTARGQLAGRILNAYGDTVIGNVEEDMSSVQNSFDSIQPPDDAASDKLRDTLDTMLSSAASDLGDLRIAARRDDAKQMASVADDLAKLAPKLDAFVQDHS
jgi:hypothetical protein